MSWADPKSRVDTLFLMASRAEVEANDIAPSLQSLQQLLTPENVPRFRRRLWFGIDGYDDDPRELYEIDEVRRWMRKLDEQFPFWFYFSWLGPKSTLRMIVMCLCEYENVPGGKRPVLNDMLKFMTEHFQALNDFCAFHGVPESELETISKEIGSYFGGDPVGE